MQFQATSAPKSGHKTGAFVLFRGEEAKDLDDLPVPDEALRKAAKAAVAAEEFQGEAGTALLLHGGKEGRRLVLAGLGSGDGGEAFRVAAAAAARMLDATRVKRATFLVPDTDDPPATARAACEGAGLALYRFVEMRSEKEKARLRKISAAPEKGKSKGFSKAVQQAAALVEGAAFARDLGNLPGNVANPSYLARRARDLQGDGISVRVHDRAAIKRLKMGAFSAVALGSRHEPRLIEIRYRGKPGAETVALVGKGVTFDTGGISIKPSQKMQDMKFDMCGGAAVLGCMHAVKQLRPKINVHALVPATDNMPDGNAYRPGDIVRARNGKTIEIISTDAEGRLLLCDALAYACDKDPAAVVDLATLTGACVVALADAAGGLFGTDETLVSQLTDAGEATGELLWRMPLFPRYEEMMQSDYADLKNGGGRWGGACTAAAFLKQFVGDVPWAHLDIAGVAWTDKDRAYHRIGATGYGVRLLVEFLERRAKGS